MSLDARHAPTPFDPEGGELSPALESALRSDAVPPVVLLVAGAAARASGWAARATVAVAAALARDRSVVVADLAVDQPELHALLGVPNLEGLADVFLFGASLPRVAQAVPGQAFEVVAAGAYVPDAAELLASSRWERIAEEYRLGGATLLAYVPGGTTGLADLAARMGAAVLLADGDDLDAGGLELPESATVLATLTPADRAVTPEPAAEAPPPPDAAAPAAEEAVSVELPEPPAPPAAVPPPPDQTHRDVDLLTPHVVRTGRRRRRLPPVLLVVLLVVAGLVGGWYAYAAFLAPPATTDMPAGAGTEAAAPAEATAAPAPPVRGRPLETELGVSVSVAIYENYDMARDRIEELRHLEGLGFYLSPFERDGVRYFRLQAGPAADLEQGRELLRRLYEEGQVTAMDDHAIRPTAWAFALGEYDTAAEAHARQQALAGMGVPSYVVEVPYTTGPSRWRVYGGAYEYRAEADAMAQILTAAGIDAELVQRMGRPAV